LSLALRDGALAQSVEQQTENLCVPGSIPGGTTEVEKAFPINFGEAFSFFNSVGLKLFYFNNVTI
jgi:hypothetical protein